MAGASASLITLAAQGTGRPPPARSLRPVDVARPGARGPEHRPWGQRALASALGPRCHRPRPVLLLWFQFCVFFLGLLVPAGDFENKDWRLPRARPRAAPVTAGCARARSAPHDSPGCPCLAVQGVHAPAPRPVTHQGAPAAPCVSLSRAVIRGQVPPCQERTGLCPFSVRTLQQLWTRAWWPVQGGLHPTTLRVPRGQPPPRLLSWPGQHSGPRDTTCLPSPSATAKGPLPTS